MTTIYAATSDQVLVATRLPKVGCNNQNTVKLHVEFDSPWNGYTKSAVFHTSKDPTPYEVILSSDGNCLIPAEVLAEEAILYIGVKGVKTASSEIKASTPIKYKVLAGTPSVVISDPTPSVYQQLLSAYNVERARMDNLLVNSGAASDDEVVDMRVGADGATHTTAGEAVRKQFSSANYARWLLDTFTTAKGKNLFDPDDPDIVFGGYYNGTNTYVESAEYNQSGFIRVEENKTYTSSDTKRLVNWYTANKNFISSTDSGVFVSKGYVTAPAGACYARFIGLVSEWSTFQVVSGTKLPNFEAYGRIIDAYKLPTSTRVIEPQNTTFFKTGKNLFNPNDRDIVFGGYYNAGVYTESAAHNQTGYISIVAGEKYTCSSRIGFVDWFDGLKKYISTTASMDFANTGYVTAPDGATYARFVATVEAWDDLQVEKGTSSTSYEPYSIKLPISLVGSNSKELSSCMVTTYGDSIVARNQWQPYVRNYFEMNHTNLGIGSTTMALVESVESDYPCMINADRIQAVKDSDPDILIIMAGTNDCHRGVNLGTEDELSKGLTVKDKTNFIGAYSYLIETLLTWKPMLQIILMTPMHSVYEVQNGYDYNKYSEAVRTIAEYYALNVADTSKKSGISKFDYTTYTADGLHPNADGARNIANVVIATIRDANRV